MDPPSRAQSRELATGHTTTTYPTASALATPRQRKITKRCSNLSYLSRICRHADRDGGDWLSRKFQTQRVFRWKKKEDEEEEEKRRRRRRTGVTQSIGIVPREVYRTTLNNGTGVSHPSCRANSKRI